MLQSKNMIILYINDEHCSCVEQLKEYFKTSMNYDSPIRMELLDYGRAGDISDWLREKGESVLADLVDNISNVLGDNEYFAQLTAIFTGERVSTEKPKFQECFHVENVTTEKNGNEITVAVQLKILSSVNESYELAVSTNWGTKGNIINPCVIDKMQPFSSDIHIYVLGFYLNVINIKHIVIGYSCHLRNIKTY